MSGEEAGVQQETHGQDDARIRRDRDPSGKARNARPRDAAGRPLEHGAPGTERVPDDLVLPPGPALAEAQRLLDAGQPFHAHEVLEGTWKGTEGDERELWRGLAQLAVGLTHLQRGNLTGAVSLLRRGGECLAAWAGAAPHGIDAAGLTSYAETLADAIEAGEVSEVSGLPQAPPRLCVRQP